MFGFFVEKYVKKYLLPIRMSLVHLVIVHNKTVYQLNVHYRTALRLLKQGPAVLADMPGLDRDAGYLIIDYDKKTLINCQDAFALPRTQLQIMEVH